MLDCSNLPRSCRSRHSKSPTRPSQRLPGERGVYTLNYMGEVNGEVGILSVNRPIPRVASVRCASVAEASAHRYTPSLPAQEPQDMFAVHQYSLPRALRALRKPRTPSLLPDLGTLDYSSEVHTHKRFPTPSVHRGLAGWMLAGCRPHPKPRAKVRRRKSPLSKPLEISTDSGELYLKYLHLKEIVKKTGSARLQIVP